MTLETVKEIVEWLKGIDKERVTFTFHGGEPLLAGADFYRQALPLLAEGAPGCTRSLRCRLTSGG